MNRLMGNVSLCGFPAVAGSIAFAALLLNPRSVFALAVSYTFYQVSRHPMSKVSRAEAVPSATEQRERSGFSPHGACLSVPILIPLSAGYKTEE